MKRTFSLLALTVLAGFGVAQAQAATAETPGDGGECSPRHMNDCRSPVTVNGVRG